LRVLKPDRHLIESADHVFQGFLSTQQQCLHLMMTEDDADSSGTRTKTRQSIAEPGILVCETKDFVEIGIKADVFYKIEDAEKVLLIVGKDNVIPLVRETSIATLNGIIRSTSLAEVAQSKETTAKSEKKHLEAQAAAQAAAPGGPPKPSAPLFFDKVHDEFISKLHDVFVDKYGIEITNIRIESFKILNQELSQNISKQALTSASTTTQLSNLAGQTEIATAQQMRDAELMRIRVESEALKLKTETDAKNRAIMQTAQAEADATLIRAKAEASALAVKAEAEAKAITLKADAEGQRAEILSKTPFGGNFAMFQLYSDMVKSSITGIEKIVYMPTGESASNPLNFLTMQQGLFPNLQLGAAIGGDKKAKN